MVNGRDFAGAGFVPFGKRRGHAVGAMSSHSEMPQRHGAEFDGTAGMLMDDIRDARIDRFELMGTGEGPDQDSEVWKVFANRLDELGGPLLFIEGDDDQLGLGCAGRLQQIV